MIKIFNENTKEWEDSKILSPYSVNLRHDESLDTAVVDRIVYDKNTLPPLTKIILIDNNKEFDFIVKNCLNQKVAYNTYLQKLELVEPLEMAKGVVLDTITFTQPLKPDSYHSKFTLASVIDRILLITPTQVVGDSEMMFFKFEIDPSIRTMFKTIESPEFSFSEFTFFDALVEIGAFVDMFPRIKFGNYKTNGKLMITFDELDIKNKTSYIVTDTTSCETQQPLENYANEVISSVQNLSVDIPISYPAGDNYGIYVSSSDDGTEITDNNAVLTLPTRIKKVTRLYAKVNWGAGLESEWGDVTNYIKEEGDWRTLTPLDFVDEPDTPASKRQIYTCYYRYNGNKIYNMKSFIKVFKNIGYPDAILRACLFRIEYIPYVNTKIKENNKATINYQTIYNQTGNIIESSSYANNLKNYVKRMENGDEVISHIYDSIDEFPKLGHLVNGLVLTNLSYTKYYNYYDVTMQLSKNYTRRAEFIRAKNEIRTWEIPADGKVVERLSTYHEKIKISLGVAVNKVHDYTKLYFFRAIYDKKLLKFKHISYLNFYTNGGFTIPLVLIPSVGILNNKVFFNIKAIDNTLIGFNKVINWDNKVNNQLGVTYTDEYGKFETFDISFMRDGYQVAFTTPTEFARTYPVSTIETNNEVYNSYADFFTKEIVIVKDARETLNFSLLIDVGGINDTLIHKNFIKSLINVEDANLNDEMYVCFLNTTITSENEIVNNNNIISIVKVTTVDYTRDTTPEMEYYTIKIDNTKVPAEYVSIAITFGNATTSKYNYHIIQNNPTIEMKNLLTTSGIIKLYVNY